MSIYGETTSDRWGAWGEVVAGKGFAGALSSRGGRVELAAEQKKKERCPERTNGKNPYIDGGKTPHEDPGVPQQRVGTEGIGMGKKGQKGTHQSKTEKKGGGEGSREGHNLPKRGIS